MSESRQRALSSLIAALALATCFWLLVPRAPEPLPTERHAKARTLVERMASRPHPMGVAEHTAVRDLLIGELQKLGIAVEVQAATVAYDHPRRDPDPARFAAVENLIGVISGGGGDDALLLMAHYDSRPLAPGAGDDAAGVAAVLAAAEALLAAEQIRRDVIVLLTDGEEMGLFGAQAFFRQHPLAARVGLVLNFEARGSAGPAFMFETSDNNGPLIKALANVEGDLLANSMSYEIYRRMPNDTDLTISKAAGIAGLNFAFIDGFADYHHATDAPANLAPGALDHITQMAVSTATYFAQTNTLPAEGPGVTYFNPWPGLLIVYGQTVALLLAALCLLAAVAALILGIRRGMLTIGGVLRGAVAQAVVLVLVVNVIESIIDGFYGGAARGSDSSYRYFHLLHIWLIAYTLVSVGALLLAVTAMRRGADWRSLAGAGLAIIVLGAFGDRFLAAFGAAVVGLPVLWLACRKPISECDLVAASWMPWIVILASLVLLVPNASYLALWPLAFALIFGFLRSVDQPLRITVLAIAAGLPALLLWVPLLQAAYLGLGVTMPQFIMGGLALILLAVMPWISRISEAPWQWPAFISLLCGVALAFWAHSSFEFSERKPAPDQLFYAMDVGNDLPVWATRDDPIPGWLAETFDHTEELALSEILPDRTATATVALAPKINPRPAQFSLIGMHAPGDERAVTVRLRTDRTIPKLVLYFTADSRIQSIAVNGQEIQAPDDLSNGWRVTWFAAKHDAELSIRHAGTEPIGVRVIEFFEGFPTATDPPIRPALSQPTPYRWSDQTLIWRDIEI